MKIFSVFSLWFYVMYLLCRLTDMVDGTIAGKTNTVSTFGANGNKASNLWQMLYFVIEVHERINRRRKKTADFSAVFCLILTFSHDYFMDTSLIISTNTGLPRISVWRINIVAL